MAYFSATGNTEGIAQHLQSILDADLYEIVPEVPYTDEDLNYSNDNCRANQEQNDPAAGPPSLVLWNIRRTTMWCFWATPSGGGRPPR